MLLYLEFLLYYIIITFILMFFENGGQKRDYVYVFECRRVNESPVHFDSCSLIGK